MLFSWRGRVRFLQSLSSQPLVNQPFASINHSFTADYTPNISISRELFDQRITQMSAHIQSNEIFKAEILFHHLWRSNRSDTKNLLSVSLFNAFIEGYLADARRMLLQNNDHQAAKNQVIRAKEWFDKISEFKFKPTENSFAIMLEYYCFENHLDEINQLFSHMEKLKLNPMNLLEDQRFENNHRCSSTLEAVLINRNYSLKKAKKSSSLVELEDNFLLEVINERNSQQEEKEDIKPPSKNVVKEVDQIKSTDSHGVKLLTRALKNLSNISASPIVDAIIDSNTTTPQTPDLSMQKYHQQEWLEEECFRNAVEQSSSKFKDIMNIFGTQKVFNRWFGVLQEKIVSHIKLKESENSKLDTESYIPFLKILNTKQMALITINEIMKIRIRDDKSKDQSDLIRTTNCFGNIADALEMEVSARYLKNKQSRKKIEMELGLHSLHSSGKLFDTEIRKVASIIKRQHEKVYRDKVWLPKWTVKVKLMIGGALCKLLVDCAKIVDDEGNEVNAFQYQNVYTAQNKLEGYIRVHPALVKQIEAGNFGNVIPRLLPMIVPPKPWLDRFSGGYLTHSSSQPLVRVHQNQTLRNLLKEADEVGHLNTVYHALDVLGSTAWRINTRVLDITLQCWNEGKDWPGGIVSAEVIPEIVKPHDFETNVKAYKEYWAKFHLRKNAEGARYSRRCDVNYKLLLAKAFENDKIYFPHYIDFRGRAYPLPVHLNHIGNDVCRGLLLFDEGKPLGDNGLRWLKIQVANLFGKDKISFSERASFVDSSISEIMDSADKPLEGNQWWLKADNPWQCLAACMELTDALRSPSPKDFISRLPIHQDGTCNGLQHYAALGGDTEGAKQVNLVPSDRPHDVYSAISSKVAAMVDEDAKNGHAEAVLMVGRITRKLVKQTVMTNTYGVTFIGAKEQVMNRLKDVQEDYGFSEETIRKLAPYITEKIFKSFGELFNGAEKIQRWLNSTARLIATSIPEEELEELSLKDSDVLSAIGALPSEYTEMEMPKDIEGGMEFIKATSANDGEVMNNDDLSSFEEFVKIVEAEKYQKLTIDIENTAANKAKGVVFEESSRNKPQSSATPLKNVTVTWTTPLGLPIAQPYRNFKEKTVKTMMQYVTYVDYGTPTGIDVRKQESAFPPNFIHSLDASHMMLSAIACKAEGLTFASVHDSYWCHATDVDLMSKILREAFVKLHKRDLMKDLKAEFLFRYQGYRVPVKVMITDKVEERWRQHLVETGRLKKKDGFIKKNLIAWVELKVPNLPEKGKFNVDSVKESKYFFH